MGNPESGAVRSMELIPRVYGELRRLASSCLWRERPDHTLQTTALVHEAYARLVDQTIADCHSRTQFFGIAANLMRQVLVNHAVRRRAANGGQKVVLETAAVLGDSQPGIDVLALNEASDRLTLLNPWLTRTVELRFFCGLTEGEIAGVLEELARHSGRQ